MFFENDSGNAALSGGATGSMIGLAGDVFSGVRDKRKLLQSMLLGGLAMGSLAGGSHAIGSAVLGKPDPDEWSPHTDRGMVGGLIGGGAVGGTLGAGLGTGKVQDAFQHRFMPKAARDFGNSERVSKNLISDAVNAIRRSKRPGLYGALAGAGLVGGAAMFTGQDEGMQMDFIKDMIERRKKEKMKKEVGNVSV